MNRVCSLYTAFKRCMCIASEIRRRLTHTKYIYKLTVCRTRRRVPFRLHYPHIHCLCSVFTNRCLKLSEFLVMTQQLIDKIFKKTKLDVIEQAFLSQCYKKKMMMKKVKRLRESVKKKILLAKKLILKTPSKDFSPKTNKSKQNMINWKQNTSNCFKRYWVLKEKIKNSKMNAKSWENQPNVTIWMQRIQSQCFRVSKWIH